MSALPNYAVAVAMTLTFCAPALGAALPVEVQTALSSLLRAAEGRDLKTLRERMIEKFTWSFGGDKDADQAVEEWAKDPRYLRELQGVLKGECQLRDATHVECPGQSALSFRAGLVVVKSEWKLEYFVAGD